MRQEMRAHSREDRAPGLSGSRRKARSESGRPGRERQSQREAESRGARPEEPGRDSGQLGMCQSPPVPRPEFGTWAS